MERMLVIPLGYYQIGSGYPCMYPIILFQDTPELPWTFMHLSLLRCLLGGTVEEYVYCDLASQRGSYDQDDLCSDVKGELVIISCI